MSLRAAQVAGVLAVACALALLLLPAHLWVLRAPLAVLLVAGLPGYSLLAAVRPTPILGPVERAMLAIGLSLATTIGLTMGASALGVPLTEAFWVLGTTTVTLVATVIAGAHPTPQPLRMAPPPPRPARRSVAAYAAAITVLLAAAVWVGTRPRPLPADVRGTVALWTLPAGGDHLTVGVQNQQRSRRSFLVRVGSGSGPRTVLRTPALRPGDRWRTTVPAPRAGAAVTATLADAADPGRVVRRVRITPGAPDPTRNETSR